MIGIKGASYRQGKGGKRKRGEEKLQHIFNPFLTHSHSRRDMTIEKQLPL
jgi:hypothetical protein